MAITIYRDHIGQRLDHPELVPDEFKHLIADDVQRVKRILEVEPRGRVLDVGCSDGAITRRIGEKLGRAVQGMDVHTPAEFYPCMIHDVRNPIPDGVFDTIYCTEVLEHLTREDAEKALDNLVAALSMQGQLIITVPNRNCADHYTAGCRDRWRWPDHRSVWSYMRLRESLESRQLQTQFQALYDGEFPDQSIWLMVRAWR